MASETRMNVGPLVRTFVLAYGIFPILVSTDILLFLAVPLLSFI